MFSLNFVLTLSELAFEFVIFFSGYEGVRVVDWLNFLMILVLEDERVLEKIIDRVIRD